MAVAAPRLTVALLLCSTYTGIVLFNNTSLVGQATVAHLNRVPIKHFMWLRTYGKVFINEL